MKLVGSAELAPPPERRRVLLIRTIEERAGKHGPYNCSGDKSAAKNAP
jgi:hypothetical protein